jgi:hypothetical protein
MSLSSIENVGASGSFCAGEGECVGRIVQVKLLASEDDRHRQEKEVQTLTDKYIAEIESTVANKERDITLHNS